MFSIDLFLHIYLETGYSNLIQLAFVVSNTYLLFILQVDELTVVRFQYYLFV